MGAAGGTGYSVGRAVPPGGRTGGGIIPPPGAWLGSGGSYCWDAGSVRRIPSVARALQLYAGMCKQMPMLCQRGIQTLPTPRLLQRPDPDNARSWFVQVNVENYLLNGNAICYVTSRGADGWPLSVAWLPTPWVSITWTPPDPSSVQYWDLGSVLNEPDVIHVKRGADPFFPVRGIGVVEEHLATFDRVAMEEAYEASALAAGAVPSVALITPNSVLTQEEADDAKTRWLGKFGGPIREPAILPSGTQVVPLAWSPTDAQLTEARAASLTDIANIFNLDSYWLGAAVQGMTYKTAAPQYQQILRTSLEPVLADFEDVWSDAWLPRGTVISFDRQQLLSEDLPTTSVALTGSLGLVAGGVMSVPEARNVLGLPVATGPGLPVPPAPPEAPAGEPPEGGATP